MSSFLFCFYYLFVFSICSHFVHRIVFSFFVFFSTSYYLYFLHYFNIITLDTKTKTSLILSSFLFCFYYLFVFSICSHFVHRIVFSFLVVLSTSNDSHSGHGLAIGLSHETKSHFG